MCNQEVQIFNQNLGVSTMKKLLLLTFTVLAGLCIALPAFASINDKAWITDSDTSPVENTATQPLMLAGGGGGGMGRGGGNQQQNNRGQGAGGFIIVVPDEDGGFFIANGDGDGDNQNNNDGDGDGDRGDRGD